MKKVAFGVQKL